MIAWHFINEDRKLGYGDNRIVEVGKTYKVDCEPILCRQGLHASIKPLDALKYAHSPIVCRVEIGGKIIKGNDKIVGTERTVLAMTDATDVLRKFARLCALDVIDKWDAPDIVVQYLKTGDESIRDAARAAARAAGAAARAARAAGAAAWDAWAAAWAAADAAYAAYAVAWAAADAAYAAGYAAGDAAEAAAREKQTQKLREMLHAQEGKDDEN